MKKAEVILARVAHTSDAELVERARGGDGWAEEALFRRHAPAVHGTVVRLLGSRHDAEDVVQDTFIAALADLERLRNPDALKPWLLQIAVRKVQRRFRRRKLLAALGLDRTVDDATLDALAEPGASPEERAELSLLAAKLDRIPSNERIAWMLRHVEGSTLPEVARLCGCSLATAKRRILGARRKLEAQLQVGELDG